MAEPERIFVTLAIDFSDDIIAELREISPRLRIERHFPDVPFDVIAKTEVLYTVNYYPEPEAAPKLRWIQMHSAGMNHALDFQIVQAEDIIATSTSGIHSTSMAQMSLMMMMMFNYNMHVAMGLQSRAEWPADPGAMFAPIAMERQTVGIVGYGSIGRELARLCASLGMTVLASKRDLSNTAEVNAYAVVGAGDPTGEIPDRIYPSETVASMAKDCDFLVITVPQTDSTAHLINDEVFEAMKETAVLVNVSRGSIVDEKALVTALSSGQIAGAALMFLKKNRCPAPARSGTWTTSSSRRISPATPVTIMTKRRSCSKRICAATSRIARCSINWIAPRVIDCLGQCPSL